MSKKVKNDQENIKNNEGHGGEYIIPNITTSDDGVNHLADNASAAPRSFLEQALDRALYSLNEIVCYAELGRSQGCLSEANDALALLRILKAQHEDEVAGKHNATVEEIE